MSGPVDIDEYWRCSDREQGGRCVKASIGSGCNPRALRDSYGTQCEFKASVPFATPTQTRIRSMPRIPFRKVSLVSEMYQPLSRTRAAAGVNQFTGAARWRLRSLIGIRMFVSSQCRRQITSTLETRSSLKDWIDFALGPLRGNGIINLISPHTTSSSTPPTARPVSCRVCRVYVILLLALSAAVFTAPVPFQLKFAFELRGAVLALRAAVIGNQSAPATRGCPCSCLRNVHLMRSRVSLLSRAH